MHPPRHPAPRPPSRRPHGASSALAAASRDLSLTPHPAPPAASGEPAAAPPPRLLDRLRAEIRLRHYSIRTEAAYVDWARRFILFHGKRHPPEMGAAGGRRVPDATSPVERNVAASTQNQAKAALLFLYAQVLRIDLPWLDEIVAAQACRAGCRWC